MTASSSRTTLTDWIDAHFDDEVAFLAELVRIPTDTPPGDNAPHADAVAEKIEALGWTVERYPVPRQTVLDYGMTSITNLIVRRRYAEGGPTVALNAHGDVVPPGEGWTRPPYGAQIEDGRMYGRATAVSKSDFATFFYAAQAIEALGLPLRGALELHFTYDEEFGGTLGPGWLLAQGLTKPDYLIGAGFSYNVVNAHNACLQFEVTVHGKATHGSIPETGHDALQAATVVLNAIYAEVPRLKTIRSGIAGIDHPTMIVGRIDGGTNTNVVPGKVVLKIDRRMIPEENPAEVEASIRAVIAQAIADFNAKGGYTGEDAVRVDIKRLLLANAMTPLAGNKPLVDAIQAHGEAVFGEKPPAVGTPLYTDVRLYVERGIPGVIYGAGPRTVLESHAKRADERLVLEDLRRATKVIARMLCDLTA